MALTPDMMIAAAFGLGLGLFVGFFVGFLVGDLVGFVGFLVGVNVPKISKNFKLLPICDVSVPMSDADPDPNFPLAPFPKHLTVESINKTHA